MMAGENGREPKGWFSEWLKRKATLNLFMAVYSLLGTVQSMSFVYIIVTLTTLEKRFKISSRTTGLMLSGNEISQIFAVGLVYYGGSGHRPRWIAVGVGLSALSCLVLALPHMIYGPGKDALALTKEYLDNSLLNTTIDSRETDLCPRTAGSEICDEGELSDISLLPIILVFISQFILGIGTTLYYGLGQTYLDDNSKKKNTPILLGLSFGLRTFGPVVGFVLGYACLSLYIDPRLHPVITQKDPRWLGAWWLGWVILSVVMGAFSVLIAIFPKELSNPKKMISNDGELPLRLDLGNDKRVITQQNIGKSEEIKTVEIPTIDEFLKAMKRLITNRIIMYNNFSAVFYILGISGLMTFYAKYMEVQFGTSAGGGTVIAGPISLFGMVLGFVLSGILISKFKPGPRILLGWNVLVGCFSLCGMIIFAFLDCPDAGIQGLNIQTSTLNLSAECNLDCNCEGIKYSPVCHEASGTTFYSACHAGCRTILDDKMFGTCACVSGLDSLKVDRNFELDQNSKINENLSESETHLLSKPQETLKSTLIIDDKVKAGPCPRNCNKPYFWFVIISCIIQTLSCSGKIGNVLVNYRSVATEDKSIAQGFSLMLVSLFALIPGPIIYGAVIDTTCLLWNEACGKKGNCWFYQKDHFRYMITFSAVGFILMGVILDALVCYEGKNLDLYGSTEDDKRREFVKAEHPVVSNAINRPEVTDGVNSIHRLEETR